ncbi:hypothetical protein ACIBPB_32265 [Micromonospora sp. NPDC049836]|uniref:hypothetical protein n=1 Tax=Micromonospora sp. NPDC049836 TaxID=3364274 RepID=UPI0037A0CB62
MFRAAGGLEPARWRPKARGAAAAEGQRRGGGPSARPGFGGASGPRRAALIKDGKYRRILPEWIDEYIQAQIDREKAA